MKAKLFGDVVRHLDECGVIAVVIGAAALGVHGVARATFDVDLMTVDRAVLSNEFWAPFISDTTVDVRRGDFTDPLAGVVRLNRAGERQVDVVVSKYRFALGVIERAQPARVRGVETRAARLPDLVLAKLFAGGPQDAWDIARMLEKGGAEVIAEVESRLGELPDEAQAFWRKVRP